ncbi:MAG: cysteine--tRNA ligase [Nanoarchaeota archaeon]|nr:cysteine--tRNA ligase [Nanoarchaeota archaeon]
MALKFYDTMKRDKVEFKSIKPGFVGMYTCGPTVYNYPHIGNYRAYVFEDILRRYLEYKGFKVKQVMNLTDIDDKTIKGAIANNVSLDKFTEPFIKGFFDDLKTLGVEPAEVYPRATEHIKEMGDIIIKLINKGYAYKGEDGSYYYSVSKFKDYGKLSHIKVDELKAGARVKQDEYEKEQAHDFALWKAWDENDGDIFWHDPVLGKGRPGWHIECSAMSMKHLGETFDIHTGGVDNMFPHHENEIAQSEAANGKKFVNYWLHCEWLLVENKKMSKSLGNFYTLRDLISKGHDAKSIRYLLVSSHYRQQLNFTFDGLTASKQTLERLLEFMRNLRHVLQNSSASDNSAVQKIVDETEKEFEKAMDDDLNTPVALASIFDFMKEINRLIGSGDLSKDNAELCIALMEKFDKVLGILQEDEDIPEEIKKLADERILARKNKNWQKSDELRDKIKALGFIVDDAKEGYKIKKIK